MSTHLAAPEPSPVVLPESPLVPNARLREIYTLMLDCRALQTRVRSLAAEGRLPADLLPPAGEEAILAASVIELRAGDTLCCSRHDWLPATLKGVPLKKLARWLLTGGGRRALGDSTHHVQALPARPQAQLAAILETATAHKRKKGSLALAFLSRELPTETLREALKTASRRRLPLLLVCRTNSTLAGAEDLNTLAQASEIPHIYIDGSDALALYRVAQEATGRARRRLGPTLIECCIESTRPKNPDNSNPHNRNSDNPNLEADPFTAMERHLTAKGAFSLAWQQETEAAFAHKLESALLSVDRKKTARA